ncbi:MAG: T9SS type A sorting domain-containing protein [Candidatus Bipolaricaulia bacterium]
MRHPKGKILWAILLLTTLSMFSVVAWGEISLHTGESGEADWWYCEEHSEVCGSCPDPSNDCQYGDNWSVELATYFEDDWAYVGLDTALRFNMEDVDPDAIGFLYTLIESNPTPQSNSGPSMAFWLFDPTTGLNHLAISAAAPVQTDTCTAFNGNSVKWWYGSADATDTEVDPESFVLAPGFAPADGQAFTDIQTALTGYQVKAVMVLMGVVGSPIGGFDGVVDIVRAGKAVVDDIKLQWDSGGVHYGGTYALEMEWDDVIGFDDGTQSPPGAEPPVEWDKWCTDELYCPHCLEIDDENLWDVVFESDLDGLDIPAAAHDFPSPSYALYFGSVATGDYDVGEAAVGTVCSPPNELNPGDQYVSISFEYIREVEQYMGAYDWTYVQIQFLSQTNSETIGWSLPGGWFDPFSVTNPGDILLGAACPTDGWKTVWYRDSSDANQLVWAEALITHYLDEDEDPYTDDAHRILIPPAATRMRIRFGFNSVDGASNDLFGWIIDNIDKDHSPEPSGCRIITDFLPQGCVNDKYPCGEDDGGFYLSPQVIDGSTTGPRSWEITNVVKDGQRTTLPRRLALDPTGRLYGELDPGTTGTYEITFLLECFEGRPDEQTLILNIRPPSGQASVSEIDCLSQDFDDGGDSCNQDGQANSMLWLVEGDPIPAVAGGPGDMYVPNFWHETGHVTHALEGEAALEYCHVAYFGKDDDSDDPDFKHGRAKGCMYSPLCAIPEEFDGEELIIGFKSWRQVEYFTGGEYDKTWVDVRIEGSAWQTVWSKSSQDPSLAAWTWQEVATGILLTQGKKIQLRFCFDSIDTYSNGEDGEAWGWLVDEISAYAGTAELSISTCPKEETSVGEYYDEELSASGGSDITPIWEIASGELPPGLGLEQEGGGDPRQAFIRGTPRLIGTFTFTIRVRDSEWDEVATRTCTIVVGEEVTLLYEDFEDDPFWSLGGLWHFTNDGGVTDVPDVDELNHAAYYGQNDNTGTPDYNTGARTTGMLTLVTPVIDLTVGPGGGAVEAFGFMFDFWRRVETFGGGGYDKTKVEAKLDDGSWVTIWERDSGTPGQGPGDDWTRDVEVGPFLTDGASTLVIRFVFDSVDKWYNDFTGWLIDNLRVQSAAAGGAGPLSAMSIATRVEPRDPTSLSVMNIPNPIRDVHTTTFMVRSVDVDAMRIEIYDLAGTLVFEEEVAGNELVWHTDNDYGEYLANGIYLYRAYVLVDGEWIATKAEKLVILR